MKSPDDDAETSLSLPPNRAASSEESIIVGAGNPTAKAVPLGNQAKRVLGSAAGEFTVPDDFNDPLSKDIEDLFW